MPILLKLLLSSHLHIMVPSSLVLYFEKAQLWSSEVSRAEENAFPELWLQTEGEDLFQLLY